MNRELLYRYLETRLSEEGFAPEQIHIQTELLREKYAAMSDGDVTADVESYGGPEMLADNVIRQLRVPHPAGEKAAEKPEEAEKPEKEAPPPPPDPMSATRTVTTDASAADTINIDARRIRDTAEEDELFAITEEELAEIERTADNIPVKTEKKRARIHTFLYEKINWEQGTPEDEEHFKKVFRLSSPLWILALLIAAILLFAAYAVLILLVPVLILAMIAVVGGGSAIALVGIIFGISKLFTVVPIALDNIGLGIIAVGITMLCGILCYNGALRLCPFLLRKMKDVTRYVISLFIDLYYYARGEVVNG